MKLRMVSVAQGLYFFVSGIWPVLHISSFLTVTGPKTDIWLVKTVGVLAFSIGSTLLFGSIRKKPALEIMFLAIVSAAVFILIDVTYYMKGILSCIYLVDAAIEIAFIVAWVYVFIKEDERYPFRIPKP